MVPNTKLTAIVEPFEDSPDSPNAVAPRQFDAVDEFVAAVGEAAGIAVEVKVGTLDDAPEHGLIMVFDEEVRRRPELGSRIILINADRSSVPACLEELRLCAAVEKHRYAQWRAHREKERGRGLFGRKNVAATIGAVFNSGYPETEHYGLMSSDRYGDLPSLLAGYLVAYAHHFGL